jgi:hypothetical protein
VTGKTVFVWGLVALFSWDSAFAQAPPAGSGESHKYRTILSIAGAAGGFVLGALGGLAAFDDAINSDRKVTLAAVSSAAGGAVGGYFIGRAIDKRKKPRVTTTQFGTGRRRSALTFDPAQDSFEDFYKTLRTRISPVATGRVDGCRAYERLNTGRVSFAGQGSGGNIRSLEIPDDACGKRAAE